MVGLLTLGSESAPKRSLQAGEAGSKQLVQVKQEGEEHGLAAHFERNSNVEGILGPDGLPPRPVNLNPSVQYEIGSGQGYPAQ